MFFMLHLLVNPPPQKKPTHYLCILFRLVIVYILVYEYFGMLVCLCVTKCSVSSKSYLYVESCVKVAIIM